MSTSYRATTSATSSRSPSTGRPLKASAAGVVLVGGQAAADDAVAVVGLAVDLLVERRHGAAVADQQRRLQDTGRGRARGAAAAAGRSAEPASAASPAAARRRRSRGRPRAGSAQETVPTVASSMHGGEEDPAELLGAHPEEALLVAAGDEHGADPDDRQRAARPERGVGGVAASARRSAPSSRRAPRWRHRGHPRQRSRAT